MDLFVNCQRVGGVYGDIPIASTIKEWKDDMKIWPRLESAHITLYLLHSKACDGEEALAYKSTEAYMYFESGFVGQLLVGRHPDFPDIIYVKGEVRPSQSTASMHYAWIAVQETARITKVLTGHCTCMAGLAKVCSHVSAIMYKVEAAVKLGYVGIACTDIPVQWNAGTKKNLEPSTIETIKFGINTPQAEPNGNVYKFIQYDDEAELLRAMENSPLGAVYAIPGTIAHDTLYMLPSIDATERERIEDNQQIENKLVTHSSHCHSDITPGHDIEICNNCYSFYQKYVNFGLITITALADATILQNNPLWMITRKIRISASVANKVPKKSSTNPQKFLQNHFHGTFKGNKATQDGNEYESKARDTFTESVGCCVELAGTHVSHVNPWLSGSPDGILPTRNAILEIKCPQEFNLEKQGVKVAIINGKVVKTLGDKRGYYTQVQINMYCTQTSLCYFYVWTEEQAEIIEVPYNFEFIKTLIARLRVFYFKYFLPYASEIYANGILEIPQTYLQFVQSK